MNPIRLRFLEDKIDFLEGIAIVRGLDMITFSQRYSYSIRLRFLEGIATFAEIAIDIKRCACAVTIALNVTV